MSLGRTPAYSAVYAIFTAVVVSMFSKETRLTPKTFGEALANGSKNTMGVAVACAMAGIIVGIVTLTGLGQDLLNVLMSVAGTSKLLALFLTMVSCIILGMGVPTTANYVIMATITAPIVMSMGVPMLAAYMFVFYFGILADLTPPVALACFAAAPIARERGLRISLQALKVAAAGFVIPFMAVYTPALMLQGGGPLAEAIGFPLAVAYIVFKTLLAIGLWGAAVIGFLRGPMTWIERALAAAAAVTLIAALPLTDEIGFALAAAAIGLHLWRRRGAARTAAAA
jgi:TRAP transporter 4TM/12TM fusion protein